MTYISRSSMTALGTVLPILSIIALAMRITSHRRYFKHISLDDIFIVPAFILSLAAGITLLVAARVGITGDSTAPSTHSQFAQVVKLEFAFNLVYLLGTACIKLSILFFFRRVFRGVALRTFFDYANWTLIILEGLSTLGFLFVTSFECRLHLSAAWDTKFYKGNQCVNTLDILVSWATVNFVLDLAILVEPLVMISRLRMTWAKKMQASAIFVISGFAVVASLMRMVLMVQLATQGRDSEVYHMVGLEYPVTAMQAITTIALFWDYLENGVGFIVACLLTSAKLLDAVSDSAAFKRLKSMSSGLLASSKASVQSKAVSHDGSSYRSKRSGYSKQSEEPYWIPHQEALRMPGSAKPSPYEHIELVTTSSAVEDV